MSVWNKILIGLIAIAGVGFIYCAAREMKTQQYWQTSARKFERRLDEVRAENERLSGGGQEEGPSILALHSEVRKWLVDRGHVWHKVVAQTVDEKTGAVAVQVSQPSPSGITDKMILAVFEEADFDKGGRFLGEFKVTGIADSRIELQPSYHLGEQELQRLAKSKGKGSWVMFDMMPIDCDDAFAGLKDEELQATLPQASVAEYLRDGKPAQADDPAERKVKGVYRRALRDYGIVLREAYRRKTELYDRIESTKRDKQQVESAVADAKKQVEYYQGVIRKLKQDKSEAERENKAVLAHAKNVEESLEQVQKLVQEQIVANQSMLSETARLQWEATRVIDQRTSTMAGGTGRN